MVPEFSYLQVDSDLGANDLDGHAASRHEFRLLPKLNVRKVETERAY
jgi:hypothetical protein